MKKFIQIGTGGFGQYWCRNVHLKMAGTTQAEAAVDVNPDALRNAVEFLHLPPEACYTDARRAFSEHRADFAVIVVPPQFHEEMIDLALEHGMDILCEKPLADTMEACCRIYRKVKKTGRKLVVTMSHRFEVEKQAVETLVKSGVYGKPNYIQSRLTLKRSCVRDVVHEDPASLITGGLIHNLDTVRGICGCNAQTVYADCWVFENAPDHTSGTSGMVHVRMENGVRAAFEESCANAACLNGWSDEYLRVECAGAAIIADHKKIEIRSDLGYPHARCAQIPLPQQKYWDHCLLVQQFLDWQDGGPAAPTNLEDNMQCCALTFAAVESLRTGNPVNVQEYLAKFMSAI